VGWGIFRVFKESNRNEFADLCLANLIIIDRDAGSVV
jgi:hypothetical protein